MRFTVLRCGEQGAYCNDGTAAADVDSRGHTTAGERQWQQQQQQGVSGMKQGKGVATMRTINRGAAACCGAAAELRRRRTSGPSVTRVHSHLAGGVIRGVTGL